MAVYLEKITISFPRTNTAFINDLVSLIKVFGDTENHILRLTRSCQNCFPELLLDFQSEVSDILTYFNLSNDEIISVKVENSTGVNKQSPYSYKPIRVETVKQRCVTAGVALVGIDHVGINLPWFCSDLHPRIGQLREELSSRCLYYRFPTGESWDFILPGDVDEISHFKTVDYTRVRRPKFELVSFDSASKPLIQFDIGVNVGYEVFLKLFPEALNDPKLRNIWLYLDSPYSVDVCLVINEFKENDWCDFFKWFRIDSLSTE
jgi:hypothetical protein